MQSEIESFNWVLYVFFLSLVVVPKFHLVLSLSVQNRFHFIPGSCFLQTMSKGPAICPQVAIFLWQAKHFFVDGSFTRPCCAGEHNGAVSASTALAITAFSLKKPLFAHMDRYSLQVTHLCVRSWVNSTL